jgi:hypothetical protein
MKRAWMPIAFAVVGLSGFCHGASAQGQFDGVWNGTVGQWTVKLVVKGEKGRLTLTCSRGSWDSDIPVGADGTIKAWVGRQGIARREVSGRSITTQRAALRLNMGSTDVL